MAAIADAVREPDEGPDLAEAIMDRFGALGGVELDLPPRGAAPRAVDLGDDDPCPGSRDVRPGR
jgi:hypothetical protein